MKPSPMERIVPVVFETAADVASAAAKRILDVASARGAKRTSLMLAGGTTPRAAYERLAERRSNLDRIDFYFGDERAVAADHPESNYRMAKEALFDKAKIPAAHIHRMRAEAEDLEAAAAEYAAALPPRIDLLLLGMGEDGHTASLFPNAPEPPEGVKVVSVVGPKPPPRRLTVTPMVIEAAREVLVLVTGEGKADALARAILGEWNPRALPIQWAQRGRFFADKKAMRVLESADRNKTERTGSSNE